MTTRQTTIRLTERTDEQLAELAELFGDRTKAITVAVDRLYMAEHGEVRTRLLPSSDDPSASAIEAAWYRQAVENNRCLACYVRPRAPDSDVCERCQAEADDENWEPQDWNKSDESH